MQRHLSYNFFSLTTDINSVSQNPLVPVAAQVPATMYYNEPGVRVDYICLPAICQFPFVSRH